MALQVCSHIANTMGLPLSVKYWTPVQGSLAAPRVTLRKHNALNSQRNQMSLVEHSPLRALSGRLLTDIPVTITHSFCDLLNILFTGRTPP